MAKKLINPYEHYYGVFPLLDSLKADVNPVVEVENDRLINLRNFLPTVFDGTDVSDFIGFFEDFLNYDLYEYKLNNVSSVDVSILKKIELLSTLRDPDLIDANYINFFANQLGYNISYTKGDIKTVTDDTEAEVNGYLRETIRSLPHWYGFKTTDNAISMLMYSFGIVSDVINLWTDDYQNNWVGETPNFEQDINPPVIPQGYYPTPHFKIEVNTTQTPPGWEDNLQNIIKLVNDIKPINTVFEGFSTKIIVDPDSSENFDTIDVSMAVLINRNNTRVFDNLFTPTI